MKIHKEIRWNPDKAAMILQVRGVAMEKIAEQIYAGKFDIFRNPRGQTVFVVWIENYPVAAPAVETEDHIFLKTAYRTRKWKARFGRGA